MNAPVLVLVHAFPMGARMWDPQRSAAPGWRIVTPSLPGFDGRPPASERTMAGFARDLLAWLDEARIDRAVFGGLSLGGYVLFELLRQAPARVSGLILANTRTSGDTPARLDARYRSIARARAEGAAAIAAEMIPGLLGPTSHATRPGVARQLRALIEAQPSETIVAGLEAIISRRDASDVLASIDVPATVIAGDEDAITTVADAAFMQARIQGASLVVIPGAGHMSNLETPAEFNRALGDLLLRVEERHRRTA